MKQPEELKGAARDMKRQSDLYGIVRAAHEAAIEGHKKAIMKAFQVYLPYEERWTQLYHRFYEAELAERRMKARGRKKGERR